ncbi:hypothetical protein P153DRAFT_401805 [Dothidotthia symphoricarpi CBS 119687]|uniref:Uncharacterized protein n=1 Tax=Dothidotthia symphoricarpi CBS 119687 TaxID=1392245 RepID=A0A6A5ZXL9_9PLEO|nr:uncharacterized protein P153DRAFT_401805 [Dothidotthia symphoricarpi CBS 119687]KAF2123654.1 hypothetical protein P153DRAFT_401805 [Dothidotthia symphoricarpi CBS 119687]
MADVGVENESYFNSSEIEVEQPANRFSHYGTQTLKLVYCLNVLTPALQFCFTDFTLTRNLHYPDLYRSSAGVSPSHISAHPFPFHARRSTLDAPHTDANPVNLLASQPIRILRFLPGFIQHLSSLHLHNAAIVAHPHFLIRFTQRRRTTRAQDATLPTRILPARRIHALISCLESSMWNIRRAAKRASYRLNLPYN